MEKFCIVSINSDGPCEEYPIISTEPMVVEIPSPLNTVVMVVVVITSIIIILAIFIATLWFNFYRRNRKHDNKESVKHM